ncbi:hypothetical protein G6F35_017831 [Rhizopus arrhizus]|nr:hypothetical protein G6F35_017831 [Rhizopus arrhizus]
MQQHVHRAGDDLQQVVEIVGDAAGELADGLQLLRLPQLLACAYQLQVRLACLFGDGGNLAAVHVALDHPLGLFTHHAEDAGHRAAAHAQR